MAKNKKKKAASKPSPIPPKKGKKGSKSFTPKPYQLAKR